MQSQQHNSDPPWPYLFPPPSESDSSELLGFAIYQDGTAFPFYSESQLQVYLGDDSSVR